MNNKQIYTWFLCSTNPTVSDDQTLFGTREAVAPCLRNLSELHLFARWSSMAAVRAVRAVAALLSADDLQEPREHGVGTCVFCRKMRPKGGGVLRIKRIRCRALWDFVIASCSG